ncbi:MAG: hypothetical protein WD688_00415 [Candidatus Binatia bacterium]
MKEDAWLTALFLWTLQSTNAKVHPEGEGMIEEQNEETDEERGDKPQDQACMRE